MKKFFKRVSVFIAIAFTALSVGACTPSKNSSNSDKPLPPKPIVLGNVTQAKNVILMIGDGMGPNQIKAGKLFKGAELCIQQFPYQTMVETRSASDAITDSAAAATAIATGMRTTNGMVGKSQEFTDLTTIIDIAHSMGKRTGVIATEELSGATPMGFASHADSRNHKQSLLETAATTSNVNLFASYTMRFAYQDIFEDAGYTKVTDVDAISEQTSEKVFGTYLIDAKAAPMSANAAKVGFDRLVTEAMEYLSKDEDGFFLMAEGSHIDHGGHDNDIKYMLDELLAFDAAVYAVLEWAKNRTDTVVIVTADHETGGLTLEDGITHDIIRDIYDNKSKQSPYYSWSTTGHTNTDVYCLINGADISFENYSFNDKYRIKNTDIFRIMCALMGAPESI